MTIPRHAIDANAAAATARSLPAECEYRVEVVTDYEALRALRPAWDELMRRADGAHPFLSHEWVCTWWESFGAGNALRVLLAKAGTTLVGVAPLMLGEARMCGLRLRRLGSLYNPHTPRSEFLVAHDAPAAYGALWRHLRDAEKEWDVLELCQLPAGSRTLDELASLASADGFRTGTWVPRGSPYVSIRGSWDDYLGALRPKHRSNLRNRFKRLGAIGEIKLEVVSSDVEQIGALEEGFRLEAAAWKGDARTAIGARPEVRRFYTKLAERMARRGWLRLQFLKLNDRRIAFGYSLCHDSRLYLLKPGYDPDYAPYSPANLLCATVLRDAFERGLTEHDFLGVDDPWKLEWTRAVRPHRWLYVFARRPRGRMLHAVKFRIVPALKRRQDAPNPGEAAAGRARG